VRRSQGPDHDREAQLERMRPNSGPGGERTWPDEKERYQGKEQAAPPVRTRGPWSDEEIRAARSIQQRLRDGYLQEEGYWLPPQESVERDPEEVWKEKERQLFGNSGDGGGFGYDRDEPKGRLGISHTLRIQLAASLVLFAAVWGVFHVNSAKTEPARQAVRDVMTKEWNFTAVSTWYEKRFGTLPSFLPAFHTKEGNEAAKVDAGQAEAYAVPVAGTIASAFADDTPWIGLATAAGTPVKAIDSGLVTNAGEQADGVLTLTVRHAGGVESTYTGLEELKLQKGDWVQKGETIGRVSRAAASGQGRFRFAVMKDGLFVNPLEWVHFD